MVIVNWLDENCLRHAVEYHTLTEARVFVNKVLLKQPIVINSLRLTRGFKTYTPTITTDKVQLTSNIVYWKEDDCKINQEILKNPKDSLQFIKEYVLDQPVIFNSIRIGDQSLKLVIK